MMNKDNIYQFYLKYEPSSRKISRLIEHEAKTISNKLTDVERLMEIAIMNPHMEYKDGYDIYLELYQKVLSKMKPKYISLNKTYFRDMYKPLEDEKNNYPFISDLHELVRRLFGC